MATTVRLPDPLQNEATRYAEGLGLSLNGLIAVALREYLDQRRRGDVSLVVPAPVAAVAAPTSGRVETRAALVGEGLAAAMDVPMPANRRGPCPCGSGKRYSQCHALFKRAG